VKAKTGILALAYFDACSAVCGRGPFYIYKQFTREKIICALRLDGDYGDIRFDDHWATGGEEDAKTIIRVAIPPKPNRGRLGGIYGKPGEQLGSVRAAII